MINRILAVSALSFTMFSGVAYAATAEVTHSEPAVEGKCPVGVYEVANNSCTIPGPATSQVNAAQVTPDGKGHYVATDGDMKCLDGTYDIARNQCAVMGKAGLVIVKAAPESVGGATASGTTKEQPAVK